MTRLLVPALLLVACTNLAAAAEFPVCINPDRTLREVEEREACKPNERRVLLEQVKPEKADIEQTDPEVAALKREVTLLKKKLEALDDRTMAMTLERRGSRIEAPMEVVGADGTILLRVASKVSSKTGDGARITIGHGDNGGVGIRVFSRMDKPLAGFGESEVGAGVIGVSGSTGAPSVVMNGAANELAIWNDRSRRAASIGATPAGDGLMLIYGGEQVLGSLSPGQNGGMLQLNNTAGIPMVEAGNTGDVGVVRAGPIMKASGMPGLPGSFILGRTK